MKATEANFLQFLKKSPRFIIPIYQRTYSWTEKECRQLWDDILRAGRNEAVTGHFVGSIVYIEKGLYQVTGLTPLLVIDGQQRLTTLTILIEALARAVGDTQPVEGFSAKKLRSYYLLNEHEDGDDRFKLLLTQTDKQSLLALVQQKPLPKERSIRVAENFQFFEDRIAELKQELPVLCRGLAKLVIVDVALSREQDNPQLIFESMNSTGRELSQADLIRNFVLMGLEPAHQTELYEDHWRPMEVGFGQEAYGTHFDSFMRHYLTVKTGDIPNLRAVYEAFKVYARSPKIAAASVDALVADIHAFARYYCAMALGSETDKELKESFQDLRELRVDVAYPFLLELYHDYDAGVLSQKDFLAAVRLVESYVFRRAICAIPTNSLNKTFSTFTKALRKDQYLESIRAHFALMPSYRRFPTDEEFHRDLQTRDLYNFPRRSYWLRRLENHGRKERVSVDEYTIEHIMPQNPNLSSAWRSALGPEWKRVQENWLHTLGNLTLTGYNSEYSDRPFPKKRDCSGGFAASPLKLNQGLGQVQDWNETEIQKRAVALADQALKVWANTGLDATVLDQYRPKSPSSGYTLNDHPYLANATVRALFDAFRTEVLALDPCVTEEVLKLYIAFKAESNFVDVEPQAKRLRLSLNMPFPDINDPRGICKDVSALGRWGNGDVEVGLSSIDDLPYVLGLVRQALERQMGDGEIVV